MERTISVSYTLSLVLALLGVYSVSASTSTFGYPVSSFGDGLASSSTATIKMTRSSRESPPLKNKTPNPSTYSSAAPLAPGTHNFSLGVGQIFLLGKIGNTYGNAIGEELHYTYGVSELLDFETNVGYSSHSSGTFTMWHLAADVRTNLAYYDQLVPFFTAGLGFYDPSYILPTTNATVSSVLFGMQLGTGIDLLVSRQVFFGARLTYHNIFSSSKLTSAGNYYDLGGSYVSFLLHIGYTFN